MAHQMSILGGGKEEGVIVRKILKRPTPMGKKQVEIFPTNVQENRTNELPDIPIEDLPFRKDVKRLLEATDNRSFIKERLDLEIKLISDHLVGVSKKLGRNLETIIDLSILILKNRKNLYTTQAVDFAIEGDSFRLLQKTNSHQETKKTIILRRKI